MLQHHVIGSESRPQYALISHEDKIINGVYDCLIITMHHHRLVAEDTMTHLTEKILNPDYFTIVWVILLYSIFAQACVFRFYFLLCH